MHFEFPKYALIFFRKSGDVIRSNLTTLHIVLESNLLLDLLQTSGLENSLWITTNDQHEINILEKFYQNVSDAKFFNRIYVISGTKSKQLVRIESLNSEPKIVFLRDIQSGGNLTKNGTWLEQEDRMTGNETFSKRKDLSGVHLKIGYIPVPYFIECDNNVSIISYMIAVNTP